MVADDGRSRGVALFGSHARDDAGPGSDVDLLVIHDGLPPEDLLDELDERVSIAFYAPTRLEALRTRSPLFALHLATEAVILDDPASLLRRALKRHDHLTAEAAHRVLTSTRRRMSDFEALPARRQTSGELYAIAKQAAMIACADAGFPEFNRRRAFRTMCDITPAVALDVEKVIALELDWLSLRLPTPTHVSTPPDSAQLQSVRRIVEAVAYVVARGY